MAKNKQKKGKNAQKFLLAVIFLYFFIGCWQPQAALAGLEKTLLLLIKLVPLLIIVLAAMVAVNLLIASAKFKKHLAGQAGIQSWLWACLAGVLISGPPYILYPLLAELKKHGAADSLLAVFLYNRNVKIPFIPVMAYYFGLKFTIIISILIIVFSFLNGWLVEKMVLKE